MKKSVNLILTIIGILVIIVVGYMATQQRPADISADKDSETAVQEEDTPRFVVGLLLPLTGDFANQSLGVRRAAELALTDSGLTDVSLVPADSACDPEQAVSATEDLIAQGAIAIIGDVCSEASSVAAQIAQDNGVVFIIPTPVPANISSLDPYVYRTLPSTIRTGAWTAQRMYADGFKRVAIISDTSVSAHDTVQGFTQAFTEAGGKVLTHQTYADDADAVQGEVGEVFAFRPDGALLISPTIETSQMLIEEFDHQGPNLPLYALGAFGDKALLDATGKTSESLIFITPSLGTRNFAESYFATYDALPGMFAAHSYDAFAAIALALNAGAQTSEDIAIFIPQTTFEGASGYVAFDEHGDVPGSFTVFKVTDGAFVNISQGTTTNEQ